MMSGVLANSVLRERARGALYVVPAGVLLLAWPLGTYLITFALIALASREGARLFGAFSGAASERRIALMLSVTLFGGAISGGAAIAVLSIAALSIIAGELYVLLDADHEHIVERAHGLIADLTVALWLSPLLLLPALASARVGFPAPLLAWLLAVVWGADTGAYLIGRRYGQRKLAPSLSPKKSIEGLIGGVAVAAVSSALVAVLLLGASPLWGIFWGALTAVAAEGGDLLESMIKRAARAENASTLIPGHGGVLDRIDSLLLALPVALIASFSLGG
jgi:phosphatidate cytidylyltransferase